MTGACFVDRDGTLMVDTHYPSDPDRVRLIAGVTDALLACNRAGVPVVIVTNQSGIGRGLLTEHTYETIRLRLEQLLRDAGVEVKGTYHCPHWPERFGRCECRKPALGMYQQAAKDHRLDLARSAYIGDKWSDVAPALATGGFGVLVPARDTRAADIERARTEAHLVPTLGDAVALFLAADMAAG